ncbi:MAG: hypothetical protein IIY52_09895 [Solobacterium sp.]|nr:hypothetical protein [Solobacterium sp.]
MKKVLLAAVLFLAGCGAGNKQDTQASLQAGIDEEAHTIVLDEDTYFSTMVMVLAFRTSMKAMKYPSSALWTGSATMKMTVSLSAERL